MDEIENTQQIISLAVSGFSEWKKYGDVSVRDNADLLIFNYTEKAQFEGRWNFFERVSRGLIVNRITGEIVARPFDKFHNWLEGNRKSEGRILSITEKLDGSLGILYRVNGDYKISTRGSFDGEQAQWATQFLKRYNLEGLPAEYTLLFEIVYPENRVVVDYGNRQDLVLLAIRNRFSGEYLPFSTVKEIALQYGFSLPTVYEFSSVDDVINCLPALDGNQEGYVVEFSDGQRFKFKGDKYKELHRLICGLSFKNTLAAVASGTVENIRSQIPDEFLGQFNSWVNEIVAKVAEVKVITAQSFEVAPKENRKDFALWVTANYKDISPYLFSLLDGRDIEQMIYKKAFESRNNDKAVNHDENTA